MDEPNNQVGSIFDVAIELPPDRRAAYVREVCAGDETLLQRVEALLRAHKAAATFMARPAVDPRAENPVVKPVEQACARIGHYKLLQQIGEGGCGVVYLAEQEEPVRRRVALKVIKLGMDTKSVIARFEAERQALALMDHPNIAKVLDAGATETGRPYFVMELVRGVKITDYCDQKNLSTKERLDLFIQICHAIQHAHQKGIIHRDIKPSNILVASNDEGDVPKVIDFGIAKATQGRLTDHTFFTAFEQFLGTPAYMSPEQAAMTSLDIDTRTDIYSLGVLLYELLTSKTPFEAKEFRQAGLDEIRRIIREEEPMRPSTRLNSLGWAEQTQLARLRQSEPPKLAQLISGDLDCVVMKALEKERVRRYETANGLAADIQRHLADEPVLARPQSRFYRLQKLARRNKLAFGAASAVAVSLILGFGLSSFLFIREKEARANEARMYGQIEDADRRARTEANRAELGQFRQQESDLLSRVIAGMALGVDEQLTAQSYLSRLADRVLKGSGSPTDHELLARFLARNVSLTGRLFQTVERPSIVFDASTGAHYSANGFGIIIRPKLTMDGVNIPVANGPVYLTNPGRGPGGVGLPVRVPPALVSTGRKIFSCVLAAQLVHAKEGLYAAAGVNPGNYEAIGTPVNIIIHPLDCFFLDELPAHCPLELRDERTAQRVMEGLEVTHATVAASGAREAQFEMTFVLPILASGFPIALAVELVQLGGKPIQERIVELKVDENGVASLAEGDDPNHAYEINSGEGKATYTIRFSLSDMRWTNPEESSLSAQIRIRSSVRDISGEFFLFVPEFKREFIFGAVPGPKEAKPAPEGKPSVKR